MDERGDDGVGLERNGLTIGMQFENGKDALKYVQDMALSMKKKVVVSHKESGGTRKRIICSCATCPFFVLMIRKQYKEGPRPWFVKSLCLEHVSCTSIAVPSCRQLTEMECVKNSVLSQPNISTKSLQLHIRHQEGIDMDQSANKVRRARLEINSRNLGYDRMDSYFNLLNTLNDGSIARVETNTDKEFKRACFISKYLVSAMNYSQRICGIDEVESTCPGYNGKQLLLVGRDGNLKKFIAAVALVNSETADDYIWFLSLVIDVGFNTSIPIFVDKHTSIISACNHFGLQFVHSAIHIIPSVNAWCRHFKANLHGHRIIALQKARTNEEYFQLLTKIGEDFGENVVNGLNAIGCDKWTLHSNLHSRPLYGWPSFHFVESEMSNTLREGLRSEVPMVYFESMVKYIMNDLYERSSLSTKWVEDGLVITPGAKKVFDEEKRFMEACMCTQSSKAVVMVESYQPSGKVTERVDLDAKTCSCYFMLQQRMPCRHFCAAMAHVGRFDEIFDVFGDEYKVISYKVAFGDAFIEIPITSQVVVTDTVHPPRQMKKIGNPKRHRSRRKAGSPRVHRKKTPKINASLESESTGGNML